MLPDPKRAVLITHANCLDGAGCEIAFIAAGGNPEDVYRVSAGEFDKFYENEWHSLQDRELIVADVYPTLEWVWDDLSNHSCAAVVIDHHHSSGKFLKDGRAFIHDECFCGTELFFLTYNSLLDTNHMSPAQHDRLLKFVSLVDRHDRWKNVDKEVEDFALLMRSIGYDAFVKRGPWPDIDGADRALVNAERRRLREKMDKILASVQLVSLHGVSYALCIVTEDQSHVLNGVLEEFPNADVVFGVNVDDSCVSLRSRPGGVDCSKIAEEHGGGGHENAAGFVMKKSATHVLLHEFVMNRQGSF